jgi:hypothetical protein
MTKTPTINDGAYLIESGPYWWTGREWTGSITAARWYSDAASARRDLPPSGGPWGRAQVRAT